MNRKAVLLILLATAVIIFFITPMIGTQHISPLKVLGRRMTQMESLIFWEMRLPRTCMAFLAGAGLALSGMALQALFRNPLATPFTLGISSGGAFGAVLYIVFQSIHFGILGFSGQFVFSLLGSALAITIVYGLTRTRHGFSTATMLLAGVAVNFFFSSLILFLQYISGYRELFQMVRWLMGGIDVGGFDRVLNVLPFTIGGSMIVFYLTRELNLMTTGEEIAISRGVEVKSVKKMVFLATSLMVGGIVAVCGPIGFVGMMAPHICRIIIGPDHRYLAPASFLFGGMFLTLCDTLARTIIAPAEIPVGVITALIGGPFFIWLLVSGSSEKHLL
jgi:iron complex transport system permease protein